MSPEQIAVHQLQSALQNKSPTEYDQVWKNQKRLVINFCNWIRSCFTETYTEIVQKVIKPITERYATCPYTPTLCPLCKQEIQQFLENTQIMSKYPNETQIATFEKMIIYAPRIHQALTAKTMYNHVLAAQETVRKIKNNATTAHVILTENPKHIEAYYQWYFQKKDDEIKQPNLALFALKGL